MDAKTRGIVAYITLIGWIIAIATNSPKEEQASFHIRQMLGLIILGFLGIIPILGLVFSLAALVFWIMGLIGAIQGEQKPLPLVGPLFQQWFKGL